MTGNRQPDRLGPWHPSDLPQAERDELHPLAEEIEASGFSLDWYGGRQIDGRRAYDALVLSVEEKAALCEETSGTIRRRAKHNQSRDGSSQLERPDVRLHPLAWPIFIEQAGVRRSTRLIDAISAALEVKRQMLADDPRSQDLVTSDN